MFSFQVLSSRPALLHRLTGLSLVEFDLLLTKFSFQYGQLVENPRLRAVSRLRRKGAGRRGSIFDIEDKLLFILVYVRIYPLLMVQGMFFNMAESSACEWVKTLLPVLDLALGSAQVRPELTRGASLDDIVANFPELKELGILTDGTERPISRPKDKDDQKDNYSGKKKRHTKKHVTLVHPKTQRIIAVSDEYPGKTHDKKILDEQDMTCLNPVDIKADSGFQGFSLGMANIILPVKKTRKSKTNPDPQLSDEHKKHNTNLASKRVKVEHSNAGFKRNRSVSDTLRNKRKGISHQLAIIAMSLHNLRVQTRISYQNN